MIILHFLGFGFGLSTSAGVWLTLNVNEHPSIFPMDAPENIPGINGSEWRLSTGFLAEDLLTWTRVLVVAAEQEDRVSDDCTYCWFARLKQTTFCAGGQPMPTCTNQDSSNSGVRSAERRNWPGLQHPLNVRCKFFWGSDWWCFLASLLALQLSSTGCRSHSYRVALSCTRYCRLVSFGG